LFNADRFPNFLARGAIMRREENLNQSEEMQINSPMTRRNRPARHILAPTDLSNESRKLIKHAMGLAQQFQAKLTLLHVCGLTAARADNSDTPASEELQQRSVQAKLSLLALHDVVRAQYSNTEACLRNGDPAEQVFLTARRLGVDVIAFSAHDFTWLRHAVDGGNIEQILRDAPCPVLIVNEDGLKDPFPKARLSQNSENWLGGRSSVSAGTSEFGLSQRST
jgi:nucleotide-binding universal stress UspA family protein